MSGATSSVRQLLLICIVLLTASVIRLVSAQTCGDHCTSPCLKYSCCDNTCDTGYGINYTDPGHCCGPCEPKCLSSCNVKGAGTCDSLCVAGYCPDFVNFMCQPKPHCINCKSKGYPKCDVCETSYTAVNGTCLKCDDNCVANCTSAYTCPVGGCKDPGYASVLIPGSTFYACSPCDVHCAGSCKVKLGGKCDATCKTGYSLNTTTYTCFACGSPQGCVAGCTVSGIGFCDCTVGGAGCAAGYTCSPALNEPTKNACYPTVA